MLVIKFGGTSVATPEARAACVKLVQRAASQGPVVVVASAVAGVTDLLVQTVQSTQVRNHAQVMNLLSRIREKHGDELESDTFAELEQVVLGLLAVGEVTPRARDLVLSFGEKLSVPILARAIGSHAVFLTGGEAGIVTDEAWGQANPMREMTNYEVRQRLGPLLEQDKIPLVTGFDGYTQHGITSILGRGGSDLTAMLLGRALKAREVWLCSDVTGLRAADPRIVPDARKLSEISLEEALEMVHLGTKGIHPRALEPAVHARMTIRILNTFAPDSGGTIVKPDVEPDDHVVRSFHLVRNIALVTVRGAAIGRPGAAAKVFQCVADTNVNIRLISQSVTQSEITLGVDRADVDKVRSALAGSLIPIEFAHKVYVQDNMAIVAITGRSLRTTVGIAGRMLQAIGEAGIHVRKLASSQRSLSATVDGARAEDGLRAVYAEFAPHTTLD